MAGLSVSCSSCYVACPAQAMSGLHLHCYSHRVVPSTCSSQFWHRPKLQLGGPKPDTRGSSPWPTLESQEASEPTHVVASFTPHQSTTNELHKQQSWRAWHLSPAEATPALWCRPTHTSIVVTAYRSTPPTNVPTLIKAQLQDKGTHNPHKGHPQSTWLR